MTTDLSRKARDETSAKGADFILGMAVLQHGKKKFYSRSESSLEKTVFPCIVGIMRYLSENNGWVLIFLIYCHIYPFSFHPCLSSED